MKGEATMTLKQTREAIKNVLIAQGGKIYNFNFNNLVAAGYDSHDLQNAHNYFKYSPQQAELRKALNM